MKALICLLLLSTLCSAQSPKPFRDANTIVIQTSLNNAEALDTVCKRLVRYGYALEFINKDYYQIKTGFRNADDGALFLLVINADAGQIRIKPQLRGEHNAWYDWEYRNNILYYGEQSVHETVLKHFAGLGNVLYERN
jgi:hypothetical protein